MSDDEQVRAIGLAVKAADDSERRIYALAAEIHAFSESYKLAWKALADVARTSPDTRQEEFHSIIKAVPERQRVLEVMEEYEETVKQNDALQARARSLRGLSK